jgi:hypothetical protein
MRFAVFALLAVVSAVKIENHLESQTATGVKYEVVNNKIFLDGCPTPIPNTEEELALQLEEFGRTLNE